MTRPGNVRGKADAAGYALFDLACEIADVAVETAAPRSGARWRVRGGIAGAGPLPRFDQLDEATRTAADARVQRRRMLVARALRRDLPGAEEP